MARSYNTEQKDKSRTKLSAKDNVLQHAQEQLVPVLTYRTSCSRYCFHYGKSSETPLLLHAASGHHSFKSSNIPSVPLDSNLSCIAFIAAI